MRPEVAADLRTIFDSPDRAEADRRLQLAVRKYEKTAPKLSAWIEENVPESLTVFSLPASHRRGREQSSPVVLVIRNNTGAERAGQRAGDHEPVTLSHHVHAHRDDAGH